MSAVGTLLVGTGAYAYRHAREDVERGLRWRGVDTAKLDLADRPGPSDGTGPGEWSSWRSGRWW